MSKFLKAGEMELRGKTAKISLDAESGDPVRMFCFVEDLEKLLKGEFDYVRIFRDGDQ